MLQYQWAFDMIFVYQAVYGNTVKWCNNGLFVIIDDGHDTTICTSQLLCDPFWTQR